MVILAGGSLGDTLPLVGLAKELRAGGVEVLLVSGDGAELLARSERLPFASLGPNPAGAVGPPGDAPAEKPIETRARRRVATFLDQTGRWVVDPLARSVERLDAIVRDGDAIVAHPIQLAAPLVAERRGLPWYTVSPATWLFRNRERAPLYLPRPSLGPTLNRLLWRRFERRLNQRYLGRVSAVAAGLGIDPPASVLDLCVSPRRTFVLTSPLFLDSRRLPATVTVTGMDTCDRTRLWRGGRALESYLNAGDPPVVFRAPPLPMPPGLREAAAAVCQRLGVRGVYLDLSAERTGLDGPLYVERYAPLSTLAPRSLAGVHYGGLGTAAMFAAAGRPSVIMPAVVDQFESAAVLASLGASVRLDWHRLSASRLAAAVEHALTLSARARDLGARLSEERGLAVTAAALTALTSTVHDESAAQPASALSRVDQGVGGAARRTRCPPTP